jgi:hypothetical protein
MEQGRVFAEAEAVPLVRSKTYGIMAQLTHNA